MSDAQTIDLLVFLLNRQRFGLAADGVVEVVRAVALAKLPQAPAIVEGVINLRGKVVAVLDIRARFRFAPKPLDVADHFVIAKAGARTIAIRADQVVDVVSVDSAHIDDARTASIGGSYVSGVAKLPDGLVLIHDLEAFLTEAEAEQLAAAEVGA